MLRSGRAVLRAEHGEQGQGRVFLLRRMEAGGVRGTLLGELSPGYLWGTLDLALSSPTARLTVSDDSSHIFFDSAPELPADEAGAVLAAHASVELGDAFIAPTWTVTLAEPIDEVLGPMVEFTRTFAFIVVSSILAVLLLSMHQIRRSLRPLEELQQGTRRLARRDFAGRVSVASGDEFEELAESFNTMAQRLERQFHALDGAAELDRTVLAATDVETIVDTVLDRAGGIFPCDAVGITLVTHEGSKSQVTFVQERHTGDRRSARVDLRSGDVQALLGGPDVVRLGPAAPPAWLEPLATGANGFIVLPLRYQGQLSGVITLTGRALAPDDDDLLQARRLADQVAVALANARMLHQVRTLAYVDSLTGLPNRLSYKERLAAALDAAGRARQLVAVFFIDLDHFSRINDTLGHEAGDQLLQEVATRLRSCCREREDEVGPASALLIPEVARLGGDEFTVIMPGLADAQDAAKLARRMLSSFAHPVRFGTHELFVNASIGIAVYPSDGEDLETLLMHADTAMYKAKEQGGSSYQSYSRAMSATALQRLTLENDLRRALERQEFAVHYQPIMDARDGRVIGAEALLRWQHPELGLLLPLEFIPLAEENGLIVPMGEWILERACIQNHDWQAAGLPPIRVSVNLSCRQLTRTLPDTVARLLRESGLAPNYLGLELTESVLVNHQKGGPDTMHALRAMGLHLSVDDFGTGYSSFAYLKHFPLDTLKIDRTFVRDIASDPDDAAITTAIIAMGHALGLRVTAEGVETEAHVALLQAQGCDELQGYHFGRPMEARAFADFLAANAQPPAGGRWSAGRVGQRVARSAGSRSRSSQPSKS
ncbi:MAG: EAL domain-containing protein [Gemmatimonadales bacterium]|nr:EAL domain-containing protein [Gemmatimonadales bacterium]